MMINFMWHRVATNPKPKETEGVLDFGVDFLNKIPILWSVLGAVLILGAAYYGARSSKIPSPVRSADQAAAAAPDKSGRMTPRGPAAAAARGRGPGVLPRRGTDAHVSTTAKPPAALPPGLLERCSARPRRPPEALGGGITNHNLRVRYGGRDVVVRLAGKDTGLLGIDRDVRAQGDRARRPRSASGPRSSRSCDDPECSSPRSCPGARSTASTSASPT